MGTIVGVNELARHLCTNREGLKRLEEQGVIARLPDGKSYDQEDCRRRYLEHLRSRPTARSSKQDALYEARAALAQLRAKKLAGELCHVSDFDDAWTEVIGYLLAALVGFPARIIRDVALRRTIEQELDRLRHDVCDHFRRRADELEGKGKAA
jgi:hypothetical protein